MFYFYALPAEPFLVLAVVYVLGAIIGPPGHVQPDSDRRLIGADRRRRLRAAGRRCASPTSTRSTARHGHHVRRVVLPDVARVALDVAAAR